MASADEDSEDYDNIDDPIKLIYSDQKIVDDCNNNSEKSLATLRRSALNSRPVVQIVDYKKFPWYYKRYKSQHTVSISEIIDLDDEDDVIIVDDEYCNIQVSEPVTVVSAESNSIIVEQIEGNAQDMSTTATKPKIRPVNIADYNLGSAKSSVARYNHLSPKTIPNKDAEKKTVKPTPNAVVTPALIDFKKNLVVGLKIVKKVTTVVSKSSSKIKDLFGDDDDIEILVQNDKHKVKQENEANNKNVTKSFMDNLVGTKILPFKGDTSKIIKTQQTATNLSSVTSKEVTNLGSPGRFCNKLVVGSKPCPHSTSSSNMTNKSDSKSEPEKKIDASANKINNASLKFTITRKNIDEYYLSINNNEENKKPKKKDRVHKKKLSKTKSEKVNKSSKRDDVSSRDKIQFKRDKKRNRDCMKSKYDSHKKHKSKLIEKKLTNITKVEEKNILEENSDFLTKSNQLNGVKYIVHTSKREVDAVNPEKNKTIDTFQDPTYLNEKVVSDVLSLQRYVDDYYNPDLTVSNPTEITRETVIARSNSGTPIQASITISYSEIPRDLTIPEQSKQLPLGFSAPQITPHVVLSTVFTDPKMTSKVSTPKNDQRSEQTSKLFKERPLQAKHKSIGKEQQTKSLNISNTPPPLCNVEPLRNSVDRRSKPFSSPNCKDLSMPSLSPDPDNEATMNNTIIESNINNIFQNESVEKIVGQNDKKNSPRSDRDAKQRKSTVQNKKKEPKQILNAKTGISCDESSAKHLQEQNKQKNYKTSTASTTAVSGMQQIQTDNIKELSENAKIFNESSAKHVQEQNNQNNYKTSTASTTTVSGMQQIQTDNIKELSENAKIGISYDESSAKHVQEQNDKNKFKTSTSSTTPVSCMQQIQIDNINELEKIKNSIEANIGELQKMQNSMQVPIQDSGHGPVQNDSVSQNQPNNRTQNTGPVLQDPSPQNVQQTESFNAIPSLLNKHYTSYGQNQNRFHYPYNNYFHNGFGPRCPMNPHRFPGPGINRAPPPWLYKSMEPRQRYPTRMPRQMFYMPPNTPPYPPYNVRSPTEMMPRKRTPRPCNTPMPQRCNTPMPPMPTSRPCNTPMPKQNQMMSPMPKDMIPDVPTSQSCNTSMPPMQNYQPCYTPMPTEMMPPMQTSQPYTTMMPPMPMPTSQSCDIPITQMPISRPYNNQMQSGMMSKSQPCNTKMQTEMMPPNSQPCNNRMENDFMHPLPAYPLSNTMMPPMQNSRQCNTPMPTQMRPLLPKPTDLPFQVSELPSMPQTHTSNIQTPANIPRPQPPCTPMPPNMQNPQPPSTANPSDTHSSVKAKTWNIPPASKYVRCSPLYETPPLNMYYPPFYEQDSSTDQSQPYHLPSPQGPGSNGLTPPLHSASNPPQRANNQIPLTESSTDNSIIGRNPDDGNLIRKIALSKPNTFSVADFANHISAYHTPPVSMPEFNASSVNGLSQSVSAKPNEFSVRPVIASPKTPDVDTPITDKSQMLVELCKAVGIEEDPIVTTPTKKTQKRSAAADSLYPTLTDMLIPKKRKFIAPELQTKNIVQVPQSGYSPPILPIPTHEKTFELLSHTRLFSENKDMDESSVATLESSEKTLKSNENMLGPEIVSNDPTIDKNNTISETSIENGADDKKEETDGKDKSVRKISLDEYKKRVNKIDDDMAIKTEIKSECLSPNLNQDDVVDGIGAIRQSTESDHGYDSDSTVRL